MRNFEWVLLPALLLVPPLIHGQAAFRYHTVTTDLPAFESARYGSPAMADFDNDGDLDFALARTHDTLYLFELLDHWRWKKHAIGHLPSGQLGGGALDVDRDGWMDVVTGGVWFRNPGVPGEEFRRYPYDPAIASEIHDLVFADISGNGRTDILVLGDREGCFWYEVPSRPLTAASWEKHPVTMDVLDSEADIHGGFFPKGVGDLDGDGDADVVLPGRWYRNEGEGKSWSRQFLPYGSSGYWGLSARSWITDMDGDGDPDIVMASCDQVDSRCVWMENNGNPVPGFTVHLLPQWAPGRRGSFHSLWVADFDLDGDSDVFTMEQEDASLPPSGAPVRAYLWNHTDGKGGAFTEHVVLDHGVGGHDVLFGDADGDGDLDAYFKVWSALPENRFGGKPHVGFLENTMKKAHP